MAISDQDIEDLAKSPKAVTTDEGTVTERSVDELREAKRHLDESTAAGKVPWGMRIARTRPGGPVV